MARFKKAEKAATTLPPTPAQPFERSYTLSKGEIILNNFIGGIFWAIGGVVGLATFLGLVSILSSYVDFIPFIGNFIRDILEYLRSNGSIR